MVAQTFSSLEAALKATAALDRDLKDPAILGHQMFSPGLDGAVPDLARRLNLGDMAQEKSNDRVCVVVTRTYDVGGHSKVAADIVELLGPGRPVTIHTDAPSEAGYAPSFRVRRMAPRRRNHLEILLSADTLVGRILELYDLLSAIRPTRIFMLTHHFDMVAQIALWPFRGIVEYLHHADHLPTVGATLPWSAHVDLTWRCYGVCRAAGLNPIYTGMTVRHSIKPADVREVGRPKQPGSVRIATCGHVNKYRGVGQGRYRWADYAVAALRWPGAELLHYGYADEALRQEIRDALVLAGLDPEAYVFAGVIPSLAAELCASDVDAFLASYPECGGKANLEAMSVGLPPIVPLDPDAAPLIRFDFPLDRWIETTAPEELPDAIGRALELRDEMRSAPNSVEVELGRFEAYVAAPAAARTS